MKVGILGTGMIVQDLLQTIGELPLEKKVLLTTPHSTEKAENLCRMYGLDGWTCDYDEMLAGDVDTIYVALPNNLHGIYTRKALAAGKNVIVEKPSVPESKELSELYDLAEEKGVYLLEAMNVYYQPAFKALKEYLPRVGQVKVVTCNFCKRSSRYGAFQMGELPPVFDVKKAGGALMDLNVYNLHLVTGLFGEPEEIRYHANRERGIDTSGVVTMDYGAFQAVCIAAKDSTSPASAVIQGVDGTILTDDSFNGFTSFRFAGQDGTEETVCPPHPEHRLCAEWQEFIRIISEKDETCVKEEKERSLRVCSLMEKAREDAGIHFGA